MYFQSAPRVTRTKMKGLDHLSNPLKTMVSAAGLEPTTHSLGIIRQYHLHNLTKQNKH